MATATITWVPTNGGSYEIWYAKLSTVGTTSTPPSTGWTQATGSPFNSSLGTATITGLDNNTQYRVDTRNDCTGSDSVWTDNIVYKLDCPTYTLVANPVGATDVGASITVNLTVSNPIELGTITGVLNLQIIQTGASSGEIFHALGQPFSTSMSYTFTNLLTSTNYSVSILMNDGPAGGAVVFCPAQSITTQAPVYVPPPTCASPSFSVANITSTTATITLTNPTSLSTGDSWDISLDGGTTYPITGITATSYNLAGLTVNTQYKVVVRYNCANGAQGFSTSQTFSTTDQLVQGFVEFTSNINALTAPAASKGNINAIFTFIDPTPVPLTIHIGFLFSTPVSKSLCSTYKGYWVNGTAVFTEPSGNCYVGDFILDGSGTGESPLVISIPQGVRNYTVTNIYTEYALSGGGPATYNTSMYNMSVRAFIGSGIPNGIAKGYETIYMQVAQPSGYKASFSLLPNDNLPGLVVLNV